MLTFWLTLDLSENHGSVEYWLQIAEQGTDITNMPTVR